jgi:hypothetical protein
MAEDDALLAPWAAAAAAAATAGERAYKFQPLQFESTGPSIGLLKPFCDLMPLADCNSAGL